MSGSHWITELVCDGLGMDDWVDLALLHVFLFPQGQIRHVFIEMREGKRASTNAHPLFPTSFGIILFKPHWPK